MRRAETRWERPPATIKSMKILFHKDENKEHVWFQSLKEASEVINVGSKTLQHWIKDGKLDSERTGLYPH